MLQGNVVAPPASTELPGGNAAMSLAFEGKPLEDKKADDGPFASAKLLKFHKEAHDECTQGRQLFERVWWRNLLYALGRQWIYYDVERGAWLDRRLAKWVPRPVINKVIEAIETLTSVFQGVQLGTTIRPNGSDPKNATTAETADKMEAPIRADHDIERVFRTGDFWNVLTGNYFLYVWMDRENAEGSFLSQYERCLACNEVVPPATIDENNGACPACRSTAFSMAEDEKGQPIGETLHEGRGRTDALGPLEVLFPLDLPHFDVTPYIGRMRFRSKRWCKNHLPEEIFSKLQFEKSSEERSLQMARSLATAGDIGAMPAALGSGSDTEFSVEGITEYEWWVKPCKDFPEGCVFRVLGGGDRSIIVPSEPEGIPGPLPLETPQGKRVFPWVHGVYEEFGGRMIGRSPLDRGNSIQDSINRHASMIEMGNMRTSNPVWLEPKGAEVKKFTGEPGLVIKYNPLLAAGNAKPERIDGADMSASVVKYLEMLIGWYESALGTLDALKGVKPAGMDSFAGMQLMVERAQARLGKVLAGRGEAFRKWYAIAIEQERAWGPRERIWAVMSPNQTWTYELFKPADLEGSITVLIEDGSTSPKTNLGMRAAVQQLQTMGFINAADPDTAYEVLKMFGQTNLMPAMSINVRSALEQQDALMQWCNDPTQSTPAFPVAPDGVDPATGQPAPTQWAVPPPIEPQKWHNFLVHVAEHKKFCNSDQVRQTIKARPELREVFTALITLDEQANAWEMQQAAMATVQPGQQPAPAGGGAGMALTNSNQEAGGTDVLPAGNGQGAQNAGPV